MKKTKTKIKIDSDLPREAIVTFLITGIEEGLLQNNWRKTMGGTQPPGPRIQKPPADEAESVTYRLSDKPEPGLKSNQLYILEKAFSGSMVNTKGGAKGVKFGKNTAVQQISGGCSFSVHKYCPLYDPRTNKPLFKFELNRDRVKRGTAHVIAFRPELPFWSCEIKVKIDERFITIRQFLELLNRSGMIAGVGDNRPQRNGYYGKYKAEVKAVEVIQIFGEENAKLEEEDII